MRSFVLFVLVALAFAGCKDDVAVADRPLCPALELNSTQAFLDAGNVATFNQLANGG